MKELIKASIKIPFLIVFFSILTACGGGNSDTTTVEPEVIVAPPVTYVATTFTGKFIDAAVIGVKYKTPEQEGMTNTEGEFIFQSDDKITFSIGDIVFPEVLADVIITPLTIFNTTDVNNIAVVNMLRLLQTLDEDGIPENGINILSEMHQLTVGLNVDFTSSDFESQVTGFLANGSQLNKQLITADEAIYHFQMTLDEINNETMSDCGSSHNKVGQSAFFTTLSHNVSGRAEILDNCTIKISQFSYDGGGPDVYFYAANDRFYDSDDAFRMGNQLNGSNGFENADLILKLPNNKTLDDLNSLSVWCVEFEANFGDLLFRP